MVGNQRPCIAKDLRILENFTQSFQKVIPVRIAAEYRPVFNASDHDVMQDTASSIRDFLGITHTYHFHAFSFNLKT